MKGSQGSYVPPVYIPLISEPDISEAESSDSDEIEAEEIQKSLSPQQWSSGICACFDDLQSCIIRVVCPCFLFGKNAEFLGSGTLMGSCATHCILWGLVNSLCCFMTDGCILCLPGCFVACYACGYRKSLRSKYNLQEAPCGDFVTHLCCHWCALCQEYREIRERCEVSNSHNLNNEVEVSAPQHQTMESISSK